MDKSYPTAFPILNLTWNSTPINDTRFIMLVHSVIYFAVYFVNAVISYNRQIFTSNSNITHENIIVFLYIEPSVARWHSICGDINIVLTYMQEAYNVIST